MTSQDNENKIDESLRLVAAFIRVKDPKARSEVIKLAERFAQFAEGESLIQFGGDRMPG